MNFRFLVHIVIMAFLAAGCAEVCRAENNREFNEEFNPHQVFNEEFNAKQEFNRQHKFKKKRRRHKPRTTPPDNVGNMYLLPSDSVDKPIKDLSTLPCWENDDVHGIAFRTQWSRVEPSEGSFFWSNLDLCASLAEANGKTFSILVTAGVTTPQWVFDAGATRFGRVAQRFR
jgi:hypothetical protein